VGVTKAEADKMDVYLCPNCKTAASKKESDAASSGIPEGTWEEMTKLAKALQTHKMAWPFLEPVDPNEVPDYYAVIKEPMDLATVSKKVTARQYNAIGDFTKDVTQIFDNCRYYNPNDSPFYQCAEVLETFFVQKLKSIKDMS